MLGLVRQHRRTGHIANGVNARDIGFTQPVGDDAAAIGLNAQSFKAQAFDIADHANSRDQAIRGDLVRGALLVNNRGGDGIGVFLHARHLRAGHDLHAELFEALAGNGGDIRIFHGENLRHDFDNSHFRAERAVEAGKLNANRARTHNDERFRHEVWHHGFKIGPNQLLIRLDARKRTRPCAGGHNNVLGGIGPLAQHALRHRMLRLNRRLGRFPDTYFAGLCDLGFTPDHINLVLLEQKTDAAIELTRHAARALDYIGDVKSHLTFKCQAVILRMRCLMENLGRAQQRLGRDAAPIETNTTEVLALYHCGFKAKLRRTNGGNISARTAANNENVVGSAHAPQTFIVNITQVTPASA